MPRWEGATKTKAMLVPEGLKDKPVAEICREHQLSQLQYGQWREQFSAHAAEAFEGHEQSQREARFTRENEQLKALVGELTLELTKRGQLLG
jgi:transposase